VAVAPRLHLANNDGDVCFKAAFPTSELKAHSPHISKAAFPLLNSKRIDPHISEKWFG